MISRMYNSEAVKHGITTNIGFVLLHIDEQNGTPATKIAPLMGMESRSLTRMLARLEERNLIHRQPDPHDGRVVRIFLTPDGLTAKAKTKEVVINFNKALYNHIPPEDLDCFFRVMDNIYEVIKTYDHAGS